MCTKASNQVVQRYNKIICNMDTDSGPEYGQVYSAARLIQNDPCQRPGGGIVLL
jgi:hypothetical protein